MELRGEQGMTVNVSVMLERAAAAVEERASMRDVDSEYLEIAALVMDEVMRPVGCEAFELFQQDYPNHDPENLAGICAAHAMLHGEWCEIPGGPVTMRRDSQVMEFYVPDFAISKFPVTNVQWQAFVDASDGYCNEYWWDFALAARQWRHQHQEAYRPDPSQPDHPCVNVSWYEAVAYCRWMGYRMQLSLNLPTEQQWQRAAQGDDGRRYPWGSEFDVSRSNTKEYGVSSTVPVTWFPEGASPYGVMDMVGNTWEWCVNGDGGMDARGQDGQFQQVVKGGSYIRSAVQAQCQRYYVLGPHNYHESIGFRLAWQRD
jgi:formylglycine-generating enzyme required for sulfatase activity